MKTNEGKDLAKARDKWIASSEGIACAKGQASGRHLNNRLQHAFIAGWDEAILWSRGKKIKEARP